MRESVPESGDAGKPNRRPYLKEMYDKKRRRFSASFCFRGGLFGLREEEYNLEQSIGYGIIKQNPAFPSGAKSISRDEACRSDPTSRP